MIAKSRPAGAFRVAISEEESLGALEWFNDEFERRLDLPGSGQGKNDILLVADEVSNVVYIERY